MMLIGHAVLFAITLFGQHFDGGEILAVVERELRAQQLGGIEVVVLLVAHVTADQRIVDAVLLDGGGAEAISLAGFEFDGDLRRVGLRIHAHIVAQHARIEVAVGRRGAQQPALERLVVRVIEAVAGLDGQVAGDVGEYLLARARARHLDVHLVDHHRLAGLDVDDDAVVLLARRRPSCFTSEVTTGS